MNPIQKPVSNNIVDLKHRLAEAEEALQSLTSLGLPATDDQQALASKIDQARRAVNQAQIALENIQDPSIKTKGRRRKRNAVPPDESLYMAIFDRSPFALSLTKMPQGTLIRANDAFLTLFDFTREEVLGKTSTELEIADADSQAQVAAELQKNRFVHNFECTRNTKSGNPRRLALSLDWVTVGGEKFILTTTLDITDQKRLEKSLADTSFEAEKERQRLAAVMEALPVGVAIVDNKGGNIQGNRAFELVWGSPRPEVDGVNGYTAYKAWWMNTGQEVQPEEWASAQAVQHGKTVTGQLMKIQRFDGTYAYIHNNGAPIFDQQGNIIGCAVAIQDISDLKQREDDVIQLNRTWKALSNSNQAMLHATNEQDFLNEVCNIIVKDCGYAMVWIGFVADDPQKSVIPVASAGFEQGYLDALKISLTDPVRGSGPTGTAIRTKQLAHCNNMLTDPKFAPWRAAAHKRGYASSIVLPLLSADRAFGALNIYSRETEGFSAAEESLLVELAGDLAHGIITLRLKVDNDRIVQALRVNEERYHSLFNTTSDGVWIYNLDGVILEVNDAYCTLSGYTREELCGMSISQLEASEASVEIIPHIQKLISHGGHDRFESKHKRKDGTIIDVDITALYLEREGGRIANFVRDVTSRKQAEEALRQNEAMLRTILDQMPSGVTVREAETGKLILANKRGREIMGILADNSPQFSFYCGKHPDGHPYTPEEWPVNRSMATGEVINSEEIDYQRSDSSHVTLSINSAPIRDPNGKITGGVGVFHDITESKHAQDRLIYLASFPERNPSPIIEVTRQGKVNFANQSALDLFPDIIEQGLAHAWLADLDEIFNQFQHGKTNLIVRDVQVGQHCYQQSINYMLPDGFVRIYGIDITNRKLAEDALRQARDELERRVLERTQELNTANNQLRAEVAEREKAQTELESSLQELQVIEEELRNNNEMLLDAQKILEEERQRYEDLFEFAPDAYLVTDQNGRIIEANQFATKLLSITHRYLLAKPLIVFVAQADHEEFNHLLFTVNDQKSVQAQELRLTPRHGPEIVSSVKVALGGEQAKVHTLRWTIRDITQRKRSEEIIRQNALRNAVLSEVSQALTGASLDEKAILNIVTKSTARLVGDSCVITQISSDGQWLEPIAWHHKNPEALDLMSTLYASTHNPVSVGPSGQVFRTTGSLLLKKIAPSDAQTSIPSAYRTYVENIGIASLLVVPIQINNHIIGTLGITRDGGGQPYTEDDQSLLEILASRTGQAIHNARLYQELQNSLRKEVEVHDQLVQTEKFAAVGRLLASITHEINNPLQTIKNCLYLSQVDTQPGTPVYDALNMAVTETNRLSNLVAQLREIYRPPTLGLNRPVDLPALIAEVQTLLAGYLQEKHVTWSVTPPQAGLFTQLEVLGVPDQLKQVFLNISLNAIDAMEPHGGSIQIDFMMSDEQNRVGVRFRDTGPGLPPEVKAKLFEPFTTTKEKGLGLGLVICYDIIQKHNGQIEVESEPGQGAAFNVWLPLRREKG